MKRLLFFAGLIVAIGSIGGNILTAHAQTAPALTPSQTAALEQQLDVAKATLSNLEQQAGIVPAGDSGSATVMPVASQPVTVVATPSVPSTPVSGLTPAQVSAFNATLNTLAATLSQLDGTISANTTLAPSQETAVQATLNGMQNTLVAMANTVSNGGNTPAAVSAPASAPVASVQPSSAPVAVNTAPAATTAPVTSAVPTPVAVNPPAAVPQTAQASSFWSFTKAHWPTIVIVLLVIAILAILFWPEKETVRTVSTASSVSGKPKSAPTPMTTPTMSHPIATDSAKPMMSSTNSAPAPATPVANAVAAPSQK